MHNAIHLLCHIQVRLLVTHGIVYLPQCDYIVVMSDGTISEIGTYSELVENEGPFAQFLSTYQSTQQDEEKDSGKNSEISCSR